MSESEKEDSGDKDHNQERDAEVLPAPKRRRVAPTLVSNEITGKNLPGSEDPN
jgi:hypothetical protein